MGTIQRQRRIERELGRKARPKVMRSLRDQWPVWEEDVREIERVFAGSVRLARMLYLAGQKFGDASLVRLPAEFEAAIWSDLESLYEA